MNLETKALPGPESDRDAASTFLPVLIQVPALSRRGRPLTHRTTGRRRLRREVRVAGTALLCGVPMAWMLLVLGAGRSEVVAAPERPAFTVSDDPPMVTISLEPVRELRPTVVLESIIPDIDTEEAFNAGG
ncbi:MAG: hypothetical protein ABI353_01375 [Isosphaeraceae bacterium]